MTTTPKQVLVIHGGTVFDSDAEYHRFLADLEISYDRLLYMPSWKSWLAEQLQDYDVLLPSMPSKLNAKYDEWALYFSKILPLLSPNASLVGHSLGGIFLAKYLSENTPVKPFRQIILIAAPYNNDTTESLKGFTIESASKLASAATEIHLLHSTDDKVVPHGELARYRQDLPNALSHVFNDRGHFNDSSLPELIGIIRP